MDKCELSHNVMLLLPLFLILLFVNLDCSLVITTSHRGKLYDWACSNGAQEATLRPSIAISLTPYRWGTSDRHRMMLRCTRDCV